jgi:hypothetical protein
MRFACFAQWYVNLTTQHGKFSSPWDPVTREAETRELQNPAPSLPAGCFHIREHLPGDADVFFWPGME